MGEYERVALYRGARILSFLILFLYRETSPFVLRPIAELHLMPISSLDLSFTKSLSTWF